MEPLNQQLHLTVSLAETNKPGIFQAEVQIDNLRAIPNYLEALVTDWKKAIEHHFFLIQFTFDSNQRIDGEYKFTCKGEEKTSPTGVYRIYLTLDQLEGCTLPPFTKVEFLSAKEYCSYNT